MPPKVTENRPSPESLHKVEKETAAAARRIVASYAEDVVDGVTLMCMLGVEPGGLNYRKFAEDFDLPDPTEDPKKAAKKTSKKATNKSTKKTTKKATKKTAKKSTAKKATAKKTTKRRPRRPQKDRQEVLDKA
ncbi:hypothetical protein [Corynebacterium atypicum]|uniref:hypothetical protein n=1 Tax=Corynebacterium atypicum TaxID=191610 RepID=UPI00068A9BA9|nr:hypothetical protein [Corynebacterium atypicum]